MADIITSISIEKTLRAGGFCDSSSISQLAGLLGPGMGLECRKWSHATWAACMAMPIINSVTLANLRWTMRALEYNEPQGTPKVPWYLKFSCFNILHDAAQHALAFGLAGRH